MADETHHSDSDSPGASGNDELFVLAYEELRRVAAARIREERPDHTLQPTALVHEAWIKLADQHGARWKSREHFVAVASEAIRRILIDHARRVNALRRGGDRHRCTLSGLGLVNDTEVLDPIALDQALDTLRSLNPRHYDVARLRFLGGLTGDQIASVLEVDRATVVRDWTTARAWLASEIRRADGVADGTDPES